MYSLISASTLGFDLVRRPGGPRAASVLATAVTLAPADLPALAQAHEHDAAREAACAQLTMIESTAPEMSAAVRDAARLVTEPGGAVTASRLLEHTAIGSLEGLLRCIRHDVFDWTWETRGEVDGEDAMDGKAAQDGMEAQDAEAARAVALVCDAAAAAYHRHYLTPVAADRLDAAWTAVEPDLAGRPAPLGPEEQSQRQLLRRLRRLDPAGCAELRAIARRAQEPGADWAGAVHEATWAVHLAGRVRTAAVAQLMAVEALVASGLTATDAASGVWNLVSGAVQGLAVRDLIGDRTLERLVAPVAGVLGPFPPRGGA
jgi:hypothetical protein